MFCRYGRQRMQTIGFMMMFVLFLICGVAYPTLTASAVGLHAFQALYFLSSFFNQFGPNCTTWLVAAEVYPTDVRATFQVCTCPLKRKRPGSTVTPLCHVLVVGVCGKSAPRADPRVTSVAGSTGVLLASSSVLHMLQPNTQH